MNVSILVMPEHRPDRAARSSEPLTAQKSAQVIPFAPYRIQRDFPDQWQAYLHAHFACIADVALAFGVSERGARKWWGGAGREPAAPRGAFVVIALRMHPETAGAYLLGDVAA